MLWSGWVSRILQGLVCDDWGGMGDGTGRLESIADLEKRVFFSMLFLSSFGSWEVGDEGCCVLPSFWISLVRWDFCFIGAELRETAGNDG